MYKYFVHDKCFMRINSTIHLLLVDASKKECLQLGALVMVLEHQCVWSADALVGVQRSLGAPSAPASENQCAYDIDVGASVHVWRQPRRLSAHVAQALKPRCA